MNNIKIYALINPINDYVFYIGATKGTLKQRLGQHICERHGAGRPKNKLLQELVLNNLTPEILQLDEVPLKDASFYEIFYQQLYRFYGFNLMQPIRSGYSEYYSRIKHDKQPIETKQVVLKLPVELYKSIKRKSIADCRTINNYILNQLLIK